MFKRIKKIIQKNIIKRLYKKVFNFYSNLETIYPRELEIKSNDKILILAPHPDDEVIGCGGLLLKYTKQCDVICLTDGRYGDEQLQTNEVIEIRKKEFESVMQKLKINNFKLLNIEDSKLKDAYNSFKKIDFKNYNYIFIPNNLDQHPDHKAVFELVLKAYKENLISKNTKIAMYEVWGALAIPNYFIDISDIKKEKRNIITMYSSQIKHIDYATKILSLNKYRGIMVGKNSIECYFVITIQDIIDLWNIK